MYQPTHGNFDQTLERLWVLRFAASLDGAKRPRKASRLPSPGSTCHAGAAARATTPLLPDDYLKMLNPLWSARELRGLIVDVHPETADSATVTIKPGWGFSGKYQPGRYVGIGLRIDGRWQ